MTAIDAETASARIRTPRRRTAVRRLLRRPPALAGLVGVVVVVLVALLAPLISPYPPLQVHYSTTLARPFSPGFLLGTDDLGRDILSRVIWGSRTSLAVGLGSTALGAGIGICVGMVAGFYRGWVDTVLMRFNDLVLSFPFLILAVGLAAILGPSLVNAILALGIGMFPLFLRVSRGEMLAIREEDYVAAAVVNGAPTRVILFRHALPNMLSPLLVQITLAIPAAIIGAAALSYLGLGVQPPAADWGSMLSEAQSYVSQDPTFAVFPGLAILLTTLSFNLVGDGLRDVLDPRRRR
ncbi:MAG TPA: ABC transporter permease [Streptosporangiaceae bacterium]|nr:ABC transporter permease [Streptosporangiaceae bacterium]